MFKELDSLVRHAPLVIRITPEGEGLRVMIHQKADDFANDAGEIPLALSVAGTAEQLDAELPAAIAAFTATASDSIAEQARKQAERAVAATPSAKAFAPAKAKVKTKAAPKKPAPVHKKAAIAHTPKPKTNKPAAAKPVKHIASKPTKEDCINAFVAYSVANPGNIKREAFIKNNPTGRRFERLFGNWDKFIAATTKAGTINPPGDKLTKPLPLETAAGNEPAATAPARTGETAEAVPPAALSAAATESLPEVWPFPPAAGTVKARAVVDTNDIVITSAFQLIVETDQKFSLAGYNLRVLDFNDTTIWVEHVSAETTAGATA